MATKPNLRLCIDRIVPMHLKARAAEVAVGTNKQNAPAAAAIKPGVKRPAALRPGASSHPAKMALYTGKMWKKGTTIGVRFLDGTGPQRDKTRALAVDWSKYANLKFKFDAGSNAEIRISFNADPGSWSAVGVDCLVAEYFKPNEPTMNFGWLTDDSQDDEWRRVVVHEFGHAIGAIHEHQNPKGGIQWNLPAVYAYFSGPPNNWSKEEIDFNVVQKYDVHQLNASKFDRKSIMLYSFPPELIKGGTAMPNNPTLSVGDKKFAAKAYPKA